MLRSIIWVTGVLQSVTWVLGILWPVRLIPKLLRFVGQIWLSMLGIRLAILLSLEEVRSLLVSLAWSRIYSLVHSIRSSLYNMLYRDRVIVTYFSFLTYTP